MVINFWQNILSIHQIPFLEALCNRDGVEINLIVCDKSNCERENMGWQTNVPLNINLKNINDINVYDYIVRSNINVVSGFFVYKELNEILPICHKENKKIFIYSEGKDDLGIKGKLRIIKDYFLWKKNFNKNIRFLAIGDKGVEWFKKIGVSNKSIYKFGYFTNHINYLGDCKKFERKIVFVGRLIPSKGVLELVDAFKSELLSSFTLDIYGNGILEDEIDILIKNYNLSGRVKRYNFIDNKVIRSNLLKYDVLVLPNVGDEGWGAVINEALQSGLKVICSKKTGSSCLIKASGAGLILDKVNNDSLVNSLLKVDSLNISRKEIIDWSEKNISPIVAADKFISIINSMNERFDW